VQVAIVGGSAGLRGAGERATRRARDAAAAAALAAGGVPAFVDDWYRAPLWAPLRAHPRCRSMRGCCSDRDITYITGYRVYALPYPNSVRTHMLLTLPRCRRFPEVRARRARGGEAAALAAALAGASPGRAPDLWDALPRLRPRLLFVAGALDGQYAALAHRMAAAANGELRDGADAEAAAGEGLGGGALGAANCDAGAATCSTDSNCGEAAALGVAAAGRGAAAGRRAEVAVVPGCGHAVPVERPGALARVLAVFLAGL
jgi:pimeloyl-ACP methyl ester carboxylesterase